MDGVAGRGFHRILSRLDDATRNRYCAEALEEELIELRGQFQHCSEAMNHAKQVDEATMSLIANAATPIHVGSPVLSQLLADLGMLHTALSQALTVMTASIPPEAIKPPAPSVPAARAEPNKLIHRLNTILTKRRRESWLNDAMDTAQAIVKEINDGGDVKEEEPNDLDMQIYEALKLLRKSLVEHMETHSDLVPVLRKLLKKLAKKRPSLLRFVEKSEAILSTKLKRVKEQPPGAPETAAVKPKKRRLSETEAAPPSKQTERKEAPAPAKPSTSSTSGVSLTKARKCASLAEEVGAGFTMQAFDTCLTATVEAVNALSAESPSEAVDTIAKTLFVLVEKAQSIKDKSRRVDRLVCLEGLLNVALTTDSLAWPNQVQKIKAQSILSDIQSLSHTTGTSRPPSSSKKTPLQHRRF